MMRKGKKKLAAGMVMACVMAATVLPAYVADADTGNTELTVGYTEQPEFHLVIPSAATNIEFGKVDTVIGDITIYGNIETKQKVTVTATKEDFKDKKDADNMIPFNLKSGEHVFSSAEWVIDDVKTEITSKKVALTVNIPTETWAGKAPGNYEAKIIFQAAISDMQP